jgi:hypothetical protein
MDILVEQLAKIIWDNTKNTSRLVGGLFKDTADEHKLISLVVPGWKFGLGRVLATLLTEEEQKTAVATLEAQLKDLRSGKLSDEPEEIKLGDGKVSISKSEMAQAFEAIHLDKKGKIIVPKYRGVTCYRRGNSLLKVNTIRMKQGMDPITELPIEVNNYGDNVVDEMRDNLLENIKKNAGARGVNNGALVVALREMFRFGASESRFQKEIFDNKRGAAQKYHTLCQLDKAYPELHIIDRIADPNDGLTSKPFDKEKVRNLLDNGASTEEVQAFIAAPNAKNAPKIMAKKDIKALAEQTPVKVGEDFLQAVLKNDINGIAKYVAHADEINAAVAEIVG